MSFLASRFGRGRALTLGGAIAGAAALSVAFTVPAGAAGRTGLVNPANSVVVGSGSSTTYLMMQQMDTLFNDSGQYPANQGCQIFVPFVSATSPQPLDFSCIDTPTPAADPENPYNDAVVEESPLGSGSGIAQLQDQGAHGATATSGGVAIPVANNSNFARSSRAFSSSDLKGLNFVAYAQDAVTWFHYTAHASVATPSGGVTNLTKAQLQAIWNGTDTNWNQVGGTNAPIVVFSAQEGSGTQGTWKSFLGYDPSASTNAVNCYTPSGGSKTCVGPAVIFENEDAQIAKGAFTSTQSGFTSSANPVWGNHKAATTAQIQEDAIFFFSFGRYSLQCGTNNKNCGGSPLPAGTTNALGSIDSVAPSQATIENGTFEGDRFLYNVYSNGSNSNIPAATGATVNYVSEVGFVCNPNKGGSSNVLDGATGKAYISEIQAIIKAQGFYPISGGDSTGTINQTPVDEGTVGNTATALLASGTTIDPNGGMGNSQHPYSDYQSFDNAATNVVTGDPMGFCFVSTTDGNANS
jgi:ABC-type phosphate transport system substrate-binding protein